MGFQLELATTVLRRSTLKDSIHKPGFRRAEFWVR